MHQTIEPAILYFGTPVVLVSTLNEDGSPNLAPMSSAWWLGWRAVLGFGASSKTPQNMIRTRECVLNLPSADQVAAVNRLARLTGSNPVPDGKLRKGYRHEADKFGAAGLSTAPSDTVSPPRAAECPVQLEARVDALAHHIGQTESRAQARQNMHMISGSAYGVRHATHPTNNSAKIFMNALTRRRRKPGLSVFRAEDEMVMQ